MKITKFNTCKMITIPKLQKIVPANNSHLKVQSLLYRKIKDTMCSIYSREGGCSAFIRSPCSVWDLDDGEVCVRNLDDGSKT